MLHSARVVSPLASLLRARVLIVEDDHDAATAMAHGLTLDGFDVQMAENGDEALAVCVEWLPDAIVLDHNLPVMTGEEFLQEIRWQPGLSRVPILLISALNDLDAIARRLQIAHWLSKPFALEGLRSSLLRMLAARLAPRRDRAPIR